MDSKYFDPQMVSILVMSWSVATRLQLDRWEALVSQIVWNNQNNVPIAGTLIWQSRIERHFCLNAADHLLTSLSHSTLAVNIDPIVAAEIAEGRDLNEHWDENMPVFNVTSVVTPRQKQPTHRTGREFAARNPKQGPYSVSNWDSQVGPKLLPHVPATALHAVLDQAQAQVLQSAPELEVFLLPRAESPWIEDWWPRPR